MTSLFNVSYIFICNWNRIFFMFVEMVDVVSGFETLKNDLQEMKVQVENMSNSLRKRVNSVKEQNDTCQNNEDCSKKQSKTVEFHV